MNRIALALALLLPLSLAYTDASLADDSVAAGSGSSTSTPTAPTSGSAAPTGSGSATTTLPTLPDPIEHPGDAVKSAGDELHRFGYIWGGMMILWGLGVALVKANDEKHWLAQDHRLSIGVSAIGILGAILDLKFGGGTLMTLGAAVAAAITLVLQKPTPGKSSTAPA